MIPVFEQAKMVHAFDRAATVIGPEESTCYYLLPLAMCATHIQEVPLLAICEKLLHSSGC
jgi:hypothetical protein